jgi:hypothetical protein
LSISFALCEIICLFFLFFFSILSLSSWAYLRICPIFFLSLSDKTKNTLKVQQEKIQSAMESKKAEIIFAAAAEYGGKIPDLSFTKLRPEIQEFVSGKHDISKFITNRKKNVITFC